MHKFLIKSLVVFYLLSSYLSAIHTHHNTFDTPKKCQVCIFVKNFQSGDVLIPLVLLFVFIHFSKLFFNTFLYRREVIKGFNSHAPPSFSLGYPLIPFS